MSQAQPLSANQLEQAFEVFTRVSHELDTSYRELEGKVEGLTRELVQARTGRLKELAEKERLAHRLSSLIAVLPGGVLIVDARQNIRDVNPEALELLGGPLIGEHWSQVIDRVASGRALKDKELRLNSGKCISVVSRQLDNSGDHVVLVTDVSEIHQLQEQLGRKKRLTALGEMAARLAHQIRTPLSSATLYLSQLSRHDLPAERREEIAVKVGDRLGHMGSLIDSMLSFVRGETPTTETIYLNQVLQSFELTVRPQVEAAGSQILVPAVDNTLMISGDQDELVGALSNLAMNALEAAEGGIFLELWVGALNDDWLQIQVRDNGPGISEDILDRVFDPFFTTRAQGNGLGLAVVARTISHHGGEISVQNRPAGGAEFLINLPIAKSVSVEVEGLPELGAECNLEVGHDD
ncbi:MAG: PAS domain-containing protein [Pseudomonadales bacterium]|nr:PAS domain-containing protein [Pseudomonadales bacterium]MCP5173023.1 PAS domain-containing protein [Pseudomonadales bacterium]MCP5302497.1 PAS domain-containing protein [Pseudomonadales bacterium]